MKQAINNWIAFSGVGHAKGWKTILEGNSAPMDGHCGLGFAVNEQRGFCLAINMDIKIEGKYTSRNTKNERLLGRKTRRMDKKSMIMVPRRPFWGPF